MNFNCIEGLTKEQIDELYQNIIESDIDINNIASCNCRCNGVAVYCGDGPGTFRTNFGLHYQCASSNCGLIDSRGYCNNGGCGGICPIINSSNCYYP